MGTGASGVTGPRVPSRAEGTGRRPGTGPVTTPPRPTGATTAPLPSLQKRHAHVAHTTVQVSEICD